MIKRYRNRKIAKMFFVIVLLCLLSLISCLVIIKSNITNTQIFLNPTVEDTVYNYFITHNVNKGLNVEIDLTVNAMRLSDNIYKCEIIIRQIENANYNIADINLEFSVDENTDIISCYYSEGKDNYKASEISYKEKQRTISCYSSGNYLYCNLIVKNNTNEEIIFPDLYELNYDINGIFPYIINKFTNISPLESNS